MIELAISWLFFNIFLALIPLLTNIVFIQAGKLPTTHVELLKDGQLFFFSTAIAASTLGNLITQNHNHSITVFTFVLGYLLGTIILISTGMFFLSSFLKLKQVDFLEPEVFSKGSTWCAGFTSIISFITFLHIS